MHAGATADFTPSDSFLSEPFLLEHSKYIKVTYLFETRTSGITQNICSGPLLQKDPCFVVVVAQRQPHAGQKNLLPIFFVQVWDVCLCESNFLLSGRMEHKVGTGTLLDEQERRSARYALCFLREYRVYTLEVVEGFVYTGTNSPTPPSDPIQFAGWVECATQEKLSRCQEKHMASKKWGEIQHSESFVASQQIN